eukprot:gnl/MRDRNA2_/MRDRNA2_102344_c0_seq1.p1 gnl/MRDRNA2_/MRDRNA2_102344_c0~~gnl/MRDRNA2_/MRDRNA2_102344_c0_seq1.p1  ORF type:complete len:271 (-),score=41.39 gnl/MRDRNA2_/MRDRNA2_102344_c0_seq1:35-847(-)
MGQCSSTCPEDPCKNSLPDHPHAVLCNAAGLPSGSVDCAPLTGVNLKAACSAPCHGPQSMDSADLGRAAPVSFRSPASLGKESWDKGFMQNSGGRGANDWEEELVAPETVWNAARHADATYSPRWNWTQRYIDYSSPYQVKSTLNALSDATWVLSSSPATPHIGTIITDWSRSMSQSPLKASDCSPQFGIDRGPIPTWISGGKENSVASSGKENMIPDMGLFEDQGNITLSSICSRTSVASSQKKTPMTLKNDMKYKRASIRNSHIGRGL